ncbi:iron uptake system component EfeO [Saccharomonospora amisosensis]|uniref:Iron uptake system component EfeO n=1 Tax=Saccharomonospora amisosensis TaxID=1128677 RepID=A0A7X5UQT0_9PSEU|nr:iron uptake system protein EfeO [Saccharomonospora amisosensis]NIJ12497.1 iron uptake system component EfeO [Saccharomonospora amisosensis]
MSHKSIAAATAAALLLLLAACGEQEGAADADASDAIAVKAGDSSCEVATTTAKAGKLTFEVTNEGSKVTEFYLYGEGDRIMGEVENISPGLTRRLIVDVRRAGTYQTACKPGMRGEGIRGDFEVTGQAGAQQDRGGHLAAATRSYKAYVDAEVEKLVPRTKEFAEAVKAGDVERAKSLFPVARTHWERIEPVAESFADLDPKIDGREDVLGEGMAFTGFHRLEKDLWVSGPRPDSARIAEQLVADVEELASRTRGIELTPVALANGAKELLDEVATGKITGEEDRYSHTDLWDFQANVDGSKAAIDALRPAILQRDARLPATLDTRFAELNRLLDKHRDGDGFRRYTDLSRQEVRELASAVDALGEPVSKVAEVVAS